MPISTVPAQVEPDQPVVRAVLWVMAAVFAAAMVYGFGGAAKNFLGWNSEPVDQSQSAVTFREAVRQGFPDARSQSDQDLDSIRRDLCTQPDTGLQEQIARRVHGVSTFDQENEILGMTSC